jgi:hemoglobin
MSEHTSDTPHDDDDAPQGRTAYDWIGGDAPVRALVDRFYDLMEFEPAFEALRAVHPPDLQPARDKLHWFLSGWLGGPNLYIERFGHPRLRARHMPYPIGIKERDQWLACMQQAMEDTGVEPDLQQRLAQAFFQTADWMRNKGAI